MADTYTQIYMHCVFAVKFRAALISLTWENELHKYITGIVQGNGHKMLAINSAFDHLHMFVGQAPKQSVSDMMQMVKADSSKFIKEKRFIKTKFQWQSGYGAFSKDRSQIDTIVKYILGQKEHHKKVTFKEEYRALIIDQEFGQKHFMFDDLEDY